jgi:hypothetical protein
MRILLALGAALFAIGCNTSPSTPLDAGTTPDTGGEGADGGTTGDDAAMNPADSGVPDTGIAITDAGSPAYTVEMGPIPVMPGEEHTQCITVRLGNLMPIHVTSIHNVLSTVSHHLIVYRVADTTEQPTPFACAPFTDTLDPTKGSPLMITQKRDELLQLPPGVAFSLNALQMVRIEMHFINVTEQPQMAQASVTFQSMADSEFRDEADFLFVGDPDISLPMMSETTLGPVFFAVPTMYSGVNFFAITGHEHHLGTGVTVEVAPSRTATGTSVYNPPGWLWSEPATVFHDPPFTIPDGGGFRFTCRWNNTTMNRVRFGESANAEMCFFWAYYYPSRGARVCAHSDQGGTGIDFCCPGDIACALIPTH